jgi:hypothetical protein
MNDDMDLTDSLRRLAAVQPCEAGPKVEQRLLAAVRARRSRKIRAWIYMAAAAVLCLVLGIRFALIDRRSRSVVYAYQVPGFVALPYAQSGVPLETVVVVRVRMRPAELSSMGVAVPAAAPTAQVTADLLVGQDGVARAVRLVQ